MLLKSLLQKTHLTKTTRQFTTKPLNSSTCEKLYVTGGLVLFPLSLFYNCFAKFERFSVRKQAYITEDALVFPVSTLYNCISNYHFNPFGKYQNATYATLYTVLMITDSVCCTVTWPLVLPIWTVLKLKKVFIK